MKAFSQYVLLAVSLTSALAQQPAYQQCGGLNWNGGKTCVSGTACTKINDYYSQCIPGQANPAPPPPNPPAPTLPAPTLPAPSPTSTGPANPPAATANVSPQWATALQKAKSAVSRLSTQDKISLTTGIGWQRGNCVGNTNPVSSINFPGLCLDDGPLGVRFADLVSAFPPGINTAATFDRSLMRQRGVAMGEEFRGKGVHVALGPAMNIARAPAAGRNWEGFGGDPYLSGEAAYETIMGVQSAGVQATAKHYINNEQEHSREIGSSNVDDKAQHELYAVPFLRSMQANVASVMCSYNQINSTYACENDKVLNGILKGEFGFPGYIMSDWWATHSTAAAMKGLDMTMPGETTINAPSSYFGPALTSAVQSGSVPMSRLDDMATRILAAWYLVGQDTGFPATNFNAWNLNGGVNRHVNVQGTHGELIRKIGAASTVLLKNSNNALPLKSPRSIGIIGSHAGPSSRGPNGYSDRGGNDGVLAMGWGSGTCDFPYLIAPSEAITTRARRDGTTVSTSLNDNDMNAARSAAAGKDAALVFITSDSGEAYVTVEGNAGDRNDLKAWHNGDNLVAAVASANRNTIVVVNAVGPIDMEAWVNHVNVTAIVWAGLPGQEAGNSLVDILYGAVNPSGRLPYTIGKRTADYNAQVIYEDRRGLQIPYNDGIFVDYRHFDKNGIAPRFEFGFGLSYTTFEYSGLTISGSAAGGTRQPRGPGSSLDPWLHDKVVTVSFTLKNSGSVAGTEIPQLYTTLPSSTGTAPKNLKGFDAIPLAAGASTTVTMKLSRFDLSFWNTAAQQYEVPSGSISIGVGASSRDIRLTGELAD